MKKVFSLIKAHVQDNATFAKDHLKSNSGDGYTWFLFMTVAFLLIFGALFTIMYTAVDMRDIRDDVDQAAMDVFADVRETAYDKITDGATNYSFTDLTNADVMRMMATHLNATYNGDGLKPFIYKLDARNKLAYRIDNFEFTYIPQVNSLDDGKSYKIGDVDRDGNVNQTDVDLIIEYIETYPDNPKNLTKEQVDLNGDNLVCEKDILLAEGLMDYYVEHPEYSNESEEEKKSALLMITFQVTVDIEYGTYTFGKSVDNYHYYSILSFKAAR
ncbi:MAG: hypothetical protein IJZ68_07075 [Bacteroidaceae bacterium]|nr:hypothetical protein [Bacteroidaceae bacterium]